ncbi:MAG: helix-turn-helix transcriptional regulator [Synergistaceae bacterium]|nr:helix-turn-helix transcriptional regulator [Synergistaceae bacterium]
MEGATRLTIRRMRQGMTQRALAKKIGIHPYVLCGIERRKLTASPERRAAILAVLGGSEAVFFEPSGLARQ